MTEHIDYGCRQGRWATSRTHLHDLRLGGLFSVGGRAGKVITKGSGSIKVRWKRQNVSTFTRKDGTTGALRSAKYSHIAPCTEVETGRPAGAVTGSR